MKYKTYRMWQMYLRQVMKGEKSHKRDDEGNPLFAEDQTEPIRGYGGGYNSVDHDESDLSDFSYH